MSDTQHTPGPWVIEYSGVLIAPKNDEVGRRFDEKLAYFPWDSYREFREGRNADNARLIAAAPDLLVALILVKKCFDSGGLTDQSIFVGNDGQAFATVASMSGIINKAIAKARGES